MPSSSDKYIGMALAVLASVGIGASSIIAKIGLNEVAKRSSESGGRASDGFGYLTSGIWWAGSGLMVIGEVANFAAYTYAPPILVTPLGALSVIFAAILASLILNEHLGHLGRVGVALCMLGSVIIVLHAPPDKEIQTVDEIMEYALQPGFMLYGLFVLCYTVYMIYKVAPTYGPRNPLVWISMCSLVGSVSIMCIKGFGIALRLTFEGHNQFGFVSTYIMAGIAVGCLLMQMFYYTKASTFAPTVLDNFSLNVVNPIYYVMFSSSTIVASILLFHGFNTADNNTILSLLAGFVTTFMGVHLLNYERAEAERLAARHATSGVSHHSRHRRGASSSSMNGAFMRSAGADTPTSASWRTGAHVTHLPPGRNATTHGNGELYRAQSSALVKAVEVDESAHSSADDARIARRRSLEPR
ncbi:DUF803-domain-containing protein [Auriculariales sp. MPI-PUGE-AT-0066]|nr:DUF803-domain-containing protein [Auriculariales sp. MPI-PUGE-AT-0066]